MTRRLSLQDQIALIYTSQGSQRAVARILGISHQKVGRILKTGQEGGYSFGSKALDDTALKETIGKGFSIHKAIVREQARKDRLPFNPDIPVFYQRLPRTLTQEVTDPATGEIRREPVIDPKTGKPRTIPGQRVSAKNIHWMSDALRQAWLAGAQKTGRFAAASLGSMVNLQVYKRRGDKNQMGQGPRNAKQKTSRKSIVEKISAGNVISPMFSKPIPLDFSPARVAREFEKVLRQKHEPATGPQLPGTMLANQVIFQVDTRNDEKPTPRAKKARTAAPRKKAPR
jgi:hypothetical protein